MKLSVKCNFLEINSVGHEQKWSENAQTGQNGTLYISIQQKMKHITTSSTVDQTDMYSHICTLSFHILEAQKDIDANIDWLNFREPFLVERKKKISKQDSSSALNYFYQVVW